MSELAVQIKCVLREIAMRERVYPKWVKDGRMKQESADYEIATMKDVLHTLHWIAGRWCYARKGQPVFAWHEPKRWRDDEVETVERLAA